MKIVFRVDASVKIVTGHVFRCLAMANGLSRLGHKCLFVCREHQSHLGDLIINQGHGLTLLPSRLNHTSEPKNERADQSLLWLGASWGEDARQTLRAIAATKTDWLIVDHYALDANWERSIIDMEKRFGLVIGLSDHTLGNTTAIASTALGASIIEKHFTLDRKGGGPDDSFSSEPNELCALCRDSRDAWNSLGSIDCGKKSSERGNVMFRRSLYCVADLKVGDTLSEQHIKSVRPGFGLAPKFLESLIGRKLRKHINKNSPVRVDDFERWK